MLLVCIGNRDEGEKPEYGWVFNLPINIGEKYYSNETRVRKGIKEYCIVLDTDLFGLTDTIYHREDCLVEMFISEKFFINITEQRNNFIKELLS